jgi:1-aminocyclopropane-1-carboxylate deaminase
MWSLAPAVPIELRLPSPLEELDDSRLARAGLLLDWVYPAKMMYGICALAERGAFAPGSTLVALITG